MSVDKFIIKNFEVSQKRISFAAFMFLETMFALNFNFHTHIQAI